MILRELFYFNRDDTALKSDDSYNPDSDTSVISSDDTRKSRLTLKQINRLRKASDKHIQDKQSELDFISRMYAMPADPSM